MTTALVTGASSGIDLEIARIVGCEHDVILAGMLARGSGRILNVASTASFQPGPLMAVYYATKAYVLSFSEAVAEETRGTGVTVTALCPGPTASGFQARAEMEDSALVKGRKLPSAASVAASVRFLPRGMVRRTVHRAQAAK